MKIPKAKKILTGILKALTGEEHAALKLGIEALHRIEDLRTKPSYRAEAPLPGETEEESAPSF